MPISIQCGCTEENCGAEPHKNKTSCSTTATEARFDSEGESEGNIAFTWPDGWKDGRCGACAGAAEAKNVTPTPDV
jgi:hypothetical protein